MQVYNIDGIKVLPPLQLNYRLDPTVNVKNSLIAFEQGYSFRYHEMLRNTKDFTFNKFSNFYLTDEHNISNIIDIQPIETQYPVTISSYLAFNRPSSDPLSGLSALSGDFCLTATSAATALTAEDTQTQYLTILLNETGLSTASDTTTVTRKLSAENYIGLKFKDILEQKYYFNVTLLNGLECVIYHVDGDNKYFLSHRDDGLAQLQFELGTLERGLEHNYEEIKTVFDDERHIFKYTHLPEENLLRLFKTHQGQVKIVELLSDAVRESPAGSGLTPIKLTTILDEYTPSDPGSDLDIDTNYPNVLELTDRTTMRLRPSTSIKNETLKDTKIVNYEESNDLSNLKVNNDRSDTVTNNMLFHSEYYYLTGNDLPINFIPLKNQMSSNENIIRGNEWDNQSVYQQRHYNKLFTGTNQLRGSDKIYLDYTSNQYEITFKPGMNYFNTPQNIEPVIRLNINDSNLVYSGSISSNIPSRADKVYKRQSNYSNTTRWGSPSNYHSGSWLCTWLKANDDGSKPTWVDRYYNPKVLTPIQAMTYSNLYDHNTINNVSSDNIKNNEPPVYDEPSKLTLEPGCNYAYYRITKQDLVKTQTSLNPFTLHSDFESYQTTTMQILQPTDDMRYKFTGKEFATVSPGIKTDKLNDLCLNFDLNVTDWKKPFAHQVVGNYTNSGIGLFNTNDVSPFLFVFASDGTPVNDITQNTSVRIYDKNFKLYNYITNDGYLDDITPPGFFTHIIIREFPDDIFFIMSTGEILQANHDGIIINRFTMWSDRYTSASDSIANVTYDDRYVYILTHTDSTDTGFEVTKFDLLDKTLSKLDGEDCLIPIPTPDELSKPITEGYGRYLDPNNPPTLITIAKDKPPFQHSRSIYVSHGDTIKTGQDRIWVLVKGERDPLSDLQMAHDVLFHYDIKTLTTEIGKITDTGVQDTTEKLEIITYEIDKHDNIWVGHSGNIVTKLSETREVLATIILEEKQIISIGFINTFEKGEIVSQCCILNRTVGGDELAIQVGPTQHPTAILNGRAYRKASAWFDNGTFNTRPLDTASVVNYDSDDPSISFDDTKHVIYPFVEGDTRFGTHDKDIDTIVSTDSTGIVLNGDYTIITESFDITVTEVTDTLNADLYDIKTAKSVTTNPVDNLTITSTEQLPTIHTHYSYSIQNFNNYPEHNLNFKILLKSKFDSLESNIINMSIDISQLNSSLPYTGFHNFNLNIDNTNGRVELWVDGTLDTLKHVATFPVNKYTFNNLLDRKITAGASTYLSNVLVGDKLGDTQTYTVRYCEIGRFAMYSKCLNRHDILSKMLINEPPGGIVWSLPNGFRNYIEGIDKVFNHSIPPRLSNIVNVNVRNSEIKSQTLQNYITTKLYKTLRDTTPAGVSINSVNWYNELLN